MGLHYYSSSSNIRIVCNCWIAFCLGSPSIVESIVIPVLWQRSHLNNHIIVIKSISLSVGILCRALYLHLQSCTFILSSMSSHLISTRWVEGRTTGKLIRYYRRCGWKGTHLRIAGRRAAHPHHSSHSLTQLTAMLGQDETDGDSILLGPSSGIIRSSKWITKCVCSKYNHSCNKCSKWFTIVCHHKFDVFSWHPLLS